jgi:hypothetical protein
MTMRMEDALVAFLKADSATNALIAGRIYPSAMPQQKVSSKSVPCIVYHRISTPREMAHDGPRGGGSLAGCAQPRFQLDLYALESAKASQLAEAVRLALDGFSGSMGGSGGVEVQAVFVEDEQSGFEDLGDSLRLHWKQLDLVIWHAE